MKKNEDININFDYYDDTHPSKDPDAFSPTLNMHHQKLWSKELPNGKLFNLGSTRDGSGKFCLTHKSDLGEFILSSDAITHELYFSKDRDRCTFGGNTSYKNMFPHEEIKNQIPEVIIDFWKSGFGIACYTIFPAKQIDRRGTINQERGFSRKICDRFDLTLECLRLFYRNEKDKNPLYEVFNRYKKFFDLFETFEGYVEYFHFQDLVDNDSNTIKFWLPFDQFNRSPLPQSSVEYLEYKKNVCDFIEKRKNRILKSLII